MKLTTTIFVAVMMGASAYGQMANPIATINGVKGQLNSAANAAQQRRNEAVQQPSSSSLPMPLTSSKKSWKQSAAAAAPGSAQSEVRLGKGPVRNESPADGDGNTVRLRGKRDPFVSVIRAQSLQGPSCSSGKKCLVVGDIALKGIVRSGTAMIAVVENGAHKTYFLHEKDPVFNGQVVKIEPDAIVFRETVVDRVGRQSAREVVKRLSKPSIS
jgi:hypothetical protein